MSKLPAFLEDQIFTGPFLMMLDYKQMSLDDPQLKNWIEEKMKRAKGLFWGTFVKILKSCGKPEKW
jgi:hypothetical protein